MGDVISYPDVPRDDRGGHAEGGTEGSFAEGSFPGSSFAGSYDELEKLFLKLKKEAEENKGIGDDELDITLADEDAIRKLEAKGNGIWATISEVAYARRNKRDTIRRQIRKGKWIVRKVNNGRSKTGYSYLIWINNPMTIKDIKNKREKMKSMKSVAIGVKRPELSVLRDMGKIDEETFNRLMRQSDTKFKFQFLVPEDTLHQVYKKGIVLSDND